MQSTAPLPDHGAYTARRERLKTYFDETAAAAWEALTSDAPVSKIRATVRAGRDEMRAHLLSRLPDDLTGRTVLDAGCGTGALAVAAAERGAAVTAVDLSPSLIDVAMRRTTRWVGDDAAPGRIRFVAGDMLATARSAQFDHIVAMDSLIHYRRPEILAVLSSLTQTATRSVLFTVAPRTPALALKHAVGGLFPKDDRAPAIEPVAVPRLARAIAADPRLAGVTLTHTHKVSRGFYTSQAVELSR